EAAATYGLPLPSKKYFWLTGRSEQISRLVNFEKTSLSLKSNGPEFWRVFSFRINGLRRTKPNEQNFRNCVLQHRLSIFRGVHYRGRKSHIFWLRESKPSCFRSVEVN